MSLDQYYTNPLVAQYCYDIIKSHHTVETFLCVEPSAGSGSFFNLLPNGSLGYDLEPHADGIIKADFFDITICPNDRPVMTIGNPPFGKNASLAVKFFNHAAVFSKVIAFILPRTFRKPSIVNRLDRRLHCTYDEILPENSFIFEEQAYDVPCVFQIWTRLSQNRELIVTHTRHPDFDFTTAASADFAIQRVGVNAGRIKNDLSISSASHYFVKSNVAGVENIMRNIDFSSVKYETAGNPSISKHEVITLYQAEKTK